MSGYRYIRRTHSTLRQLRKLRELEDEFNIQDTATLVSAYNEARASHEHHDELLHWIGNYIPFFEKETASECCHEAMELAHLANIIPMGPSEMKLLQDAFNVLCRKIQWEDYEEWKFIEAFNYFLLSVDCKIFESNSHPFTKIARDVLNKLGSEQTFSRGTYPTHSISILTVHHLCAVIHEVDPNEFDHDKQEGLYQQMNRCLQNIIDSQSYYPFYFQAILTQQSLACMDSNKSISSKEIRYRLLCGLRGTAYVGQAIAGAISLNFDLDNLENGVKLWIEACTSGNRIKQQSWYENVQPLIDSRLLVQSNPEKLDIFVECLSKVEELQDKEGNKETRTALRFAMIQEATHLALDSQDESVRDWAIYQLSYFGKCCAPDKGWAQDPIIIEALVKAVLRLRQKLESYSVVEGLLATIGFHIGADMLREIETQWREETQWKGEDKETSSSKARGGGESLFNKIKKEMSLDDSISSRVEDRDVLKKYYQQHAEVQSLFENEAPKHVNELEHSLLLHERVIAPNGQVRVEQRPIYLKDLYKNRQTKSGSLTDKVKRVLLFGNPGTGKTTIAKKIAYKWSVDEWGDAFDMLYLVPIRELSSSKYDDSTSRKQRNVQTAITNICFPGECDEVYESHRSQVKEELEKESTLVVFDGLDEGDEMTKDIIKSTESKSCRVMVLSRPQNLQREKVLANVEVECIGLDDEQLIKFIESECSSNELVKHLQMHPNVWDISHTPVVASILTFLCKSRKEYVISEAPTFNMFSLYTSMSFEIWKRYVKKDGKQIQRDHIFGVLGEIAFRALEKQEILIGQYLVEEYNQDSETSDILKDSGFLLLKRECIHYQFPHLSFQEFFAGQHLSHSLLSKDEERRQDALDFLKENKYCANFKQVFYFMIQALTLKKRKNGYLEVESIINDRPIALGYQQHLCLSTELLEAALSASNPQDRDTILNSTKILDRAFVWIESQECYGDALATLMFASVHNPDLDRVFGTSINDTTEEFTMLFAQIARVARYVDDQWEKLKNILKTDLDLTDGLKFVRCIIPLMRTIPEERHDLLELYWECIDHNVWMTSGVALSYLSDIVRLMPNYVERLFERVQSKILDDTTGFQGNLSLIDFPTLAQLIPDRLQEILKMIKRACFADKFHYSNGSNQVGRLVESVPESGGQVMELIWEWSSSTHQSKIVMALSCVSLIKAMPENATEIVEILWTLCEDKDENVCDVARAHVIKIMLSWGEKTDSAVDTLLRLSQTQPQSTGSSLVRLIAIAYKLVEETHEGVDRLLTSLSRGDLLRLWEQITYCILDLIGTKTEQEMGLHWLHFRIIEADDPSEIEDQELHMMMDSVNSDPNKVAVKSAKLFCIAQSPGRNLAPMALCKVAICCHEYKEELFDSIDVLTKDEDEFVAQEACVNMFSLLERHPQMAERVINSLQESLHCLTCFEFIRMRESVSLDFLFKAYMMSGNNLLVFFIAWKSFDMPVTMETRRNGTTEMVVQTASNNKKKYKFQTIEQAQEFASSFDECIEVVFPDVASFVPRLDSQERQHIKNPLFTMLRERLTTSFWK